MDIIFDFFNGLEIADWFAQIGDAPDANAPPAEGGDGGAGAAKGGGGLGQMWPFLALMFGVMMVFMLLSSRPAKKQQAKRQEMLDSLKKSDRVLTAGGIVGVIASNEKDSDFVILRIDEANNAKIKILRSSIARLLTDEDKKKITEES